MAAYAALVSVRHIINDLLLHSRPPILLQIEQAYLLTKKVTLLQQFLEVYNPNLPYSKEADPLESRIARAAYAAEDAIESHIYQFTNSNGEKMSSYSLYEALEKVIEEMELIKKEAMEIKETGGFQNQLQAKSTPPYTSISTTSSISQKCMMVGVDDLLLEMKDKLTSHCRDLQIIPIVGMGGSGKTTLALSIYEDGLVKEHFHTCAWVTISQEYSIRQILVQLLTQLVGGVDEESSVGELGEMLHKHLYSKKFIIDLDDMWSIKAWDGVKRFLPNNKNGSRIVITTRLTTLASTLPNSNSLGMKLLDEVDSWDLLLKTVFGEKGCPPRFEEIGKKIGKNCKGLPLSIMVVGGLLAKSKQTIESWEYIEENLNAIVNLDDDERCLKILHMSYKQLPVHLKPCFLYMGIYCEDHNICIANLVKLWVAEGFLKSVSGKMLEDVARAYLNELIDRNLIMIHWMGSIGSIKYCKVHDLLRDLCLREAKKEGFYGVYPGQNIYDSVSRIVMSSTKTEIEEIDVLSLTPPVRSLISGRNYYPHMPHFFRPMRIVDSDIINSTELMDNMHQLVNIRFLTLTSTRNLNFPCLIRLCWNIKTLDVRDVSKYTAPNYIWHMFSIRHLYFYDLCLPDPPNVQEGIILANLQTVGRIRNFTCSPQMVKRIPNIRKLNVVYDYITITEVHERYCLTNLDCLDKLESFKCFNEGVMCPMNYPQSLKKLFIKIDESQCWENILDKIGALPLLQKLKLSGGTFKGRWKTIDGQFRSLKLLCLLFCKEMDVWTSEASHFPILEHLHLYHVFGDHIEIPLDFAEIPTLKLIEMNGCSDSGIESAKRILEEQEALYGEEETTLRVHAYLSRYNNPTLESLRSPNFHVVEAVPVVDREWNW